MLGVDRRELGRRSVVLLARGLSAGSCLVCVPGSVILADFVSDFGKREGAAMSTGGAVPSMRPGRNVSLPFRSWLIRKM